MGNQPSIVEHPANQWLLRRGYNVRLDKRERHSRLERIAAREGKGRTMDVMGHARSLWYGSPVGSVIEDDFEWLARR